MNTVPSAFPHRCWAEIDLAALENNVRSIRSILPKGIRYISVIKANGYGIGAAKAAAAIKAAGASAFAVANLTEAAALRESEPEIPILLLSATTPDEDRYLPEFKITPTISTPEETARYEAVAEKRGQPLGVHLKFDTGMGRLGTWHACADELIRAVENAPLLDVRGVYSHFASAGEDAEFTALQRQRFFALVKRLRTPPALVHIDNSGGVASFTNGSPCNAVRVGLLQTGTRPVTGDPAFESLPLRPVVSFHARVSVIKHLPAGASVSYGRTHKLARDSRVAAVTAGYADGIIRACGNRGEVLVRGRRCPILGRVTMDGFIIDVTDLPEVACGDRVTIFGRQEHEEISLHEFSAWCGTIPWESLCALSQRVTRVYKG